MTDRARWQTIATRTSADLSQIDIDCGTPQHRVSAVRRERCTRNTGNR